MYSLMILPHSTVIYCHEILNGLHESKGERVTRVGYSVLWVQVLIQQNTLAGITTEISGLGAEAIALLWV